MRSRKAKSKAIMYKGFLHLHRSLLECQDFISLKGNSIKLLIDLGYQYNGYNNGDLCASLSVMRKRGWNSNQQLAKALKELLERNLIVQTKLLRDSLIAPAKPFGLGPEKESYPHRIRLVQTLPDGTTLKLNNGKKMIIISF